MNNKSLEEAFEKLFQNDFVLAPRPNIENMSREEIISAFNKDAEKMRLQNPDLSLITTMDFQKNIRSREVDFESLRPINIGDLEVGKAHRGRAVFCQIVSQVLVLKAKTVLIEDGSRLTPLSIYGHIDTSQLRQDRKIAIVEPFYKLRADGTKGIRVDDPRDLVFDVDAHHRIQDSTRSTTTTIDQISAETRMRELLKDDEGMGTRRLHKTLLEEGFSIQKKQIRVFKAEILKEMNKDESDGMKSPEKISILSQRQPKKHRVLCDPRVSSHRDAGNRAFANGKMEEAERQYSLALEMRNEGNMRLTDDEKVPGVHLWQLYSNRCAARIRLGKLDEALKDGLESNMCCPVEVVKPLLRCAEALAALGLQEEFDDLLKETVAAFPSEAEKVLSKQRALSPKCTLRVGEKHEFQSISAALLCAPEGAEILVDPGIYRESLFVSKAVTIRSSLATTNFTAIQALEGDDTNQWAEIRVEGCTSIVCNCRDHRPVHFIGLRVICHDRLASSNHAAFVSSGVVVFRNCMLTSSSGPVVATENSKTMLILQACGIHGGAQGGILACESAHISVQQVHCCHNAACGLELRTGASGTVSESHFYDNGQQGIMVWHSAGRLTAKHSFIHSNRSESGVLVSESEAVLEHCWIYGNGAAGVVSQQKGNLSIFKCEVHDNVEGILIQDTASARVEQCKVFCNRANGIFVGYDHLGNAAIVDNHVHDNQTFGVHIGNLGRVVVRGNTEENNRGLPFIPTLSSGSGGWGRKGFNTLPKFLKRAKKNEPTRKQAIKHMKPGSIFEEMLKGSLESGLDDVALQRVEKLLKECAFCKAVPKETQTFAKCSRCKSVSYCSKKCQKIHWPQHKTGCVDKSVKYPAFIDNDMSC